MKSYKSQLERAKEDLSASQNQVSAYQQAFSTIGAQWAQLLGSLKNIPTLADGMDTSASELSFSFQDPAVVDLLARGEFDPAWFKETDLLITSLVDFAPALSHDAEKTVTKENIDLTHENTSLKMELSNVKNREKQLIETTDQLSGKLIYAERKVQRLQSDIVKQFTQSIDTGAVKSETMSSESLQNQMVDVEKMSPEPLATDNQELLNELHDLRVQHEIARSEADGRGHEIMEVQKENTHLINQLDQAVMDLQLLPEHRIVESGPYRYLEQCLQHAKEDLIIYKKQNEDFRHELEQLSSERSSFIEQFVKEEDAKTQHYEGEIKKLNGEVNRIRLMRDNLQHKCDLLNKEKVQPESEIKQLRDSLELYRKHVEFLMQGINRSRIKLAADQGDEEFYRNALLSIDLEFKNNITGELPQYKTLVDGLQDEVQRLRAEIAQSPIADGILKQDLDTANTKLEGLLSACEKNERISIEKLLLKLEAHKSTESMAMMEMESIADNYTKLDTKYRQTLDMMTAKDSEITRHISDKVKIEHKMTALGKEKENIGNKVIALQKASHKQNEIIKKLEEGDLLKTEIIHNLEKESASAKGAMALHENRLREVAQISEELNAKLEKNTSKYQELSHLLKQKEELIAYLKHQKRFAEEEAKRLEIKLKHAPPPSESTASGGTIVDAAGKTVDLDVLQGYKKIAQCTVCNFRIKDRVLRTCWHCFCEECINTRVETRQRKCPQCGQAFGPGDIKPIYI